MLLGITLLYSAWSDLVLHRVGVVRAHTVDSCQ